MVACSCKDEAHRYALLENLVDHERTTKGITCQRVRSHDLQCRHSHAELRTGSNDTGDATLEKRTHAFFLGNGHKRIRQTLVMCVACTTFCLKTRFHDVEWSGQVGSRHAGDACCEQQLSKGELMSVAAFVEDVLLRKAKAVSAGSAVIQKDSESLTLRCA